MKSHNMQWHKCFMTKPSRVLGKFCIKIFVEKIILIKYVILLQKEQRKKNEF